VNGIQDGYPVKEREGVNAFKVTALSVVGLLLLVGIVVGGWQLGWWLNKANANKQYEVNTHTQQYQAGLISQERDDVIGWEQATDANQRDLIKGQFCTIYLNLTQPPADLVFANSKICTVP
jgi:hypothetical protein